jgi:hypothetical protein
MAVLGVPGLIGAGGAKPLISLLQEYADSESGVYWGVQDSNSTCVAYPNTALNGTHTGVTLQQTGPAGTLAGLYDGSNDYTDVITAGLQSLFDPTIGSIVLFARMANAGVWTDTVPRVMLAFTADAQNYVQIRRWSTDGLIKFRYEANNIEEVVDDTTLNGSTNDFALGITWDTSADGGNGEFKAYCNGSQVGATLAIGGVWAGTLASATIGALNTTPSVVHNGYLSNVLYVPVVFSAAQMLGIAQAGGVA